MTVIIYELTYRKLCDMCELYCEAGEVVYYNPITKNAYHLRCIQRAEVGE